MDKYFQELKNAVADLNLDVAEEERRLNELEKAQHVTLYDFSPKKVVTDSDVAEFERNEK